LRIIRLGCWKGSVRIQEAKGVDTEAKTKRSLRAANLQSADCELQRASIERSVSQYYSAMSDSERIERSLWARFAFAQISGGESEQEFGACS